MLLLLFLRQLLVVLLLFRVQLLLLLLVFLVRFSVPRVRSRRTLVRLQVLGIVWNRGTRNIVRWTTALLVATLSCIRRTRNVALRTPTLLVSSLCRSRRMVRCSCLSGRHRSPPLQFSWSSRGCDWWPALVNRSPLLRVIASRFFMLSLSSYGRYMPLVFRRLFFGCGPDFDSTVSSVVTHPVHRSVVDHRGVVNIVNVRDIHVVHGTVVEELTASPFATFIAMAEIAESVVDAAVESDVRTPIADMENECRAAPTPPS